MLCRAEPSPGLLWFSDGAAELCGMEREEFCQRVSREPLELVYQGDRERLEQALGELLSGKEFGRCTCRIYHKSGELRWMQLSVGGLAPGAEGCTFYVVVLDVTEEKLAGETKLRAVRELRWRAEVDGLTGLWNRETFCRLCEERMAREPKQEYVLLRWNVRNFKVVNDLFGTQRGDDLLRSLSTVLRDHFENVGLVGRLGGDHFAALLPKQHFDLDDILSLTDIIQVPGTGYAVSVCVGIYPVEESNLPVAQMCDRAKLAIQSVRDNYLCRYGVYNQAMRRRLLEEQAMTGDMRTAMEKGQFRVCYQPVYCLSTGLPVGAEALVRWEHPLRGLLTPDQFIPTMEKNGFITKVDLWVLEQVCIFQQRRKQEGQCIVPISINLSQRDLDYPTLCKDIPALVEGHGLIPEDIKLEITETAYTQNFHHLLKVMEVLQEQGFQILLDDFGSGYSSLNMLKDLPVNLLKIDMKLVGDMGISPRAGKILNTVIHMANLMEIQVVAEGVSTQTQVDFLRQAACDLAQGYFFARPLRPEDFSRLLADSLEKEGQPALPAEEERPRLPPGEEVWQGYACLDYLPVGVGVWELGEPIHMCYSNTAMQEILDVGHTELGACVSLWGGDLTAQEQKELRNWRALGEGDIRRSERLMVCKDRNGTPSWIQVFFSNVGRRNRPTLCYAVLMDVTEAKGLEGEYHRKSELYQILLKRSELMIVEYELAADRLEYSYRSPCGVREQVVREQFAQELTHTRQIHPGDVEGCRQVVEQAVAGPCQGELEFRSLNAQGPGYRWYRALYNTIQAPSGRTQRIVGICMDVELEKSLAAKLVEAATDGVSGLWNRAAAEKRIQAALREDRTPYAYFLYDIDNFKQVNDTFGHQEGDRLLVRVAQVLRASFRETDIIGRLGGDEFVVLMRNLSSPETARERAGATVRAMQELSDREDCPLPISVSLGVAYDGAAAHDFCQLYQRADQALYRAKREGKNRHVFLEMGPAS